MFCSQAWARRLIHWVYSWTNSEAFLVISDTWRALLAISTLFELFTTFRGEDFPLERRKLVQVKFGEYSCLLLMWCTSAQPAGGCVRLSGCLCGCQVSQPGQLKVETRQALGLHLTINIIRPVSCLGYVVLSRPNIQWLLAVATGLGEPFPLTQCQYGKSTKKSEFCHRWR